MGLRTVLERSGWEEEETGTDKRRNFTLCQVRGLGRWFIDVEVLSGTCYFEEGGTTVICRNLDCHPDLLSE